MHVFSTPTEPETALPPYRINGVTGIRDMGALWPIARQQTLQASIEAGEVLGPRLILSDAWGDASPGIMAGDVLGRYARSGAGGRGTNRNLGLSRRQKGWAAVKAYSMLDDATYRALAKAAMDAGLPWIRHIPG